LSYASATHPYPCCKRTSKNTGPNRSTESMLNGGLLSRLFSICRQVPTFLLR